MVLTNKQWIHKGLTGEKLVACVKKEKFDCEKDDLFRLLEACLTLDDAQFTSERCRIQFILLLQLYASCGGRISVFFEDGAGIRWKVGIGLAHQDRPLITEQDIAIARVRGEDGVPRWTARVLQRYVKNNPNPEAIT